MAIILNCTLQLRTRPQYCSFGSLRKSINLRKSIATSQFSPIIVNVTQSQFKTRSMAFGQGNREELEERARQGETVVPDGTGGKSVEAQENLAEGRRRGGEKRKEQLGSEGYHELGEKGGQTRKEQMGTEGYKEMGRKGGLSTKEKSGGERAAEEGIDIDESKFKNT